MTQARGSRPLLRAYTIAIALVGWFAVLLQLALSLQLAVSNGKSMGAGLVIYLSYFTVLTNILVAVTLTFAWIAPATKAARFFARPGVNTAIATCIAVVGIAYSLLLRRIWNPQGWQLVADHLLHDAMPILFLAYWWVAVPKDGLRFTQLPAWLLYPIGYLIYSLVRGALTGTYSYPFIDVSTIGYGQAITNALLVLLAFVVVASTLLLVSRLDRIHPPSGDS